jgi:hypothetical protein
MKGIKEWHVQKGDRNLYQMGPKTKSQRIALGFL